MKFLLYLIEIYSITNNNKFIQKFSIFNINNFIIYYYYISIIN